ncbi:MAG: hypothetical protein KHZ90_08445 [Veillonella parvula]|uniref:Uncharacterized protein n=1 Tax=Veillonella parvula TaxID=29466 RepID=A0A942WV72_VEIPA|nr:hypothetical protein [Veillonella parvula]MBS4893790.1 hypothetical protein [Veillonella parvula]
MSDKEVKYYICANFRNGRQIKLNQLKLLSKYNIIKNNSLKYGGIIDYLQGLGFVVDGNTEYKINEYDEYLMSKRRRLARYA